MMNRKTIEEIAYSIWEIHGKPDGNQMSTCPVCNKLFLKKDLHWQEAIILAAHSSDIADWEMSKPRYRELCKTFHRK